MLKVIENKVEDDKNLSVPSFYNNKKISIYSIEIALRSEKSKCDVEDVAKEKIDEIVRQYD